MQFNKDGEKVIEELKLRVVYNSPSQIGHENSEEESGLASYKSRASNVKLNSSHVCFQMFSFTFFYCLCCMIHFFMPQVLKDSNVDEVSYIFQCSLSIWLDTPITNDKFKSLS